MASRYGSEFYRAIGEGSRRSAKIIVPLIIELAGPVASVVDVGCGTGQWLAEFADHGVTDFIGLDGPYVDPELLVIPRERFTPADLITPPVLRRRFDVALCLEVAEHLPPSSADNFVRYLADLSDVVIFSAAIPFQGGASHINEQWPQYWVDKFADEGYVALDPFRSRLWMDHRVEAWFAQNVLVFVANGRVRADERLAAEERRSEGHPMPIVHPSLYLPKAKAAARLERLYERPFVRFTGGALRILRKLFRRARI